MKRKKRIEKILNKNFKSWNIQIKDISNQHKGHNNFTGIDETHFLLEIIKNNNGNLKKIDIHRKINFLLKDEFLSGLHALQIKIKD